MGKMELVATSIAFGGVCGIAALMLIESMRGLEKGLRRFEKRPYLVAAAGGAFLAVFFAVFGTEYAGLGVATIDASLQGAFHLVLAAFLLKIVATSVTLESGGSGGIVTPIFFIGSTAGAAFAEIFHLPVGIFAAFGFVAMLAAAANTPIAAAVMGIELLPGQVGVYAALAAGSAFLLVGHRSVYASQKIGLSKSAGLDVTLDIEMGELTRAGMTIRDGSLTQRLHRRRRRDRPPDDPPP